MKTRQIHGLGLGEFLIFAPAKEMLKSAYFFSALPEGLEIFPENRRLDLAFPYNPGVTFAPSTKMTA